MCGGYTLTVDKSTIERANSLGETARAARLQARLAGIKDRLPFAILITRIEWTRYPACRTLPPATMPGSLE